MAISIKSDYIALIGQNIISRANKSLSTSMQRLSTGYKINATADDPAGYIAVVGLNSQLRGLKLAQSNNQNSYAMLSTAESVLGNVHDIASRLRELAIQGSSNTLTQEQRNSLQLEANQLTKELYRTLNSSKYNGQQILGKANSTPPPNGVTPTASSVSAFGNSATASLKTEFTPLTEAEAIAQGYTLIKSEQDFLNMYKNATVNGSNREITGKYILMTDIDATSINAELADYSANLGGEFNGNGHTISNLCFDDETKRIQGGLFYSATENATIKNVNIENLYILAQGSMCGGVVSNLTGTIDNVHVSGKIVTGSFVLGTYVGGLCAWMHEGSSVKNSSFVGEVVLDNSIGDGSKGAAGIAIFVDTNTEIENVYGNLTVTKTESCAGQSQAVGGIIGCGQNGPSHNIVINNAYSTIQINEVDGSISNTGQIITDVTNSDNISLNNVYFEQKSADDVAISNDRGGTLNGSAQGLEHDEFNNKVLEKFNVPDIILNADKYEIENGFGNTRLQIGAGSDSATNSLNTDLTFDISGFSVDFSSANKSSKSIEKIDKLLKMATEKQSYIGATMSRLESIVDNQLVQIENVTSALSAVQDADIAEETANYVKTQIRVQTSTTLFAQTRNLQVQLTLSLVESVLI